jgi:hypothetical protein
VCGVQKRQGKTYMGCLEKVNHLKVMRDAERVILENQRKMVFRDNVKKATRSFCCGFVS